MIIIIGAGMAGVTLARCLKDSGIPFRIFDQQSGWKRQGFGLTLRDKTTQQLLPLLKLEELEFRNLVAVDRRLGNSNNYILQISSGKRFGAGSYKEGIAQKDFRTNRERLRSTIMGDVTVEYGHKVVNFERRGHTVRVNFENGVSVTGDVLVAADGVHSFFRGKLLPQCTPEDFDGIFINGTRRYSMRAFNEQLRPSIGDSAVIVGFGDNFLLGSTIYDVDHNPETGYVDLSYAYSRRRKGPNDPLHVSYLDRKFDKTKAPPALWEEFAQLPRPLIEPFRTIFYDAAERQDPTIHHQLVSLLIPRERLSETLAEHNVVFMGDAVHDWSNHAGTAANAAIQDAIALAKTFTGGRRLEEYYEERYSDWVASYEKNGQDFEALHRPKAEWDILLAKQEVETGPVEKL